MDLYFARPRDIVVAKIDLKNGAVGIVPDWENVVVTGHFAAYQPDTSRLEPEYLIRLLQTKFFKAYLWRNKVGAEGRKEVKLGFFESIPIPLPPLDTQRAIVVHWQQAREEIRAAESQSDQLNSDLMHALRKRLGRVRLSEAKRPKAFALSWKTLERWGVELAWKTQTPQTVDLYPPTKLASICRVSSGGTPSRKHAGYFGGEIPWVKTTEVRDDVILTTEETLTHEGLKHSSARIYPVGSVIVAMYGQGATRGRTAKLGIDSATNQACAVLTDFEETIEPDFLWYYLMSEYDDLRAMASGNNQPNLNAAMIANYPVPLPPLSVQREIIQEIESGRAEAARLKNLAAQIRTLREAEIEAMILGTTPVTTA